MNEKITIYARGKMFGTYKTEGKLIRYGRRPYAQYASKPFVDFVPKGKRTPRRIQTDYQPFLVIVSGWDRPNPPDGFITEESASPGLVIKTSKYSSCDPRYETDFNQWFHSLELPVIADFRHTHGGDQGPVFTVGPELKDAA